MNENSKYLLKLIQHTITRSMPEPPGQSINWKIVKDLAKDHNILSILYSTVSLLPKEQQPNKEEMNSWKANVLQTGIRNLNINTRLKRLIEECNKNQVNIYIVKGVILADTYPEPLLRVSGDIDIIVDPGQYNEFSKILVRQGFQCQESLSFAYETSFLSQEGIKIEVHCSLWEEPKGSRLSRLESLHLAEKDTIICKEIDGVLMPTLDDTEHIIYIIYHMIKHFSISGIGIRHLMDLDLFVERYKDVIDMDRFWNCMKELGYYEFCCGVFCICHDMFGLSRELLPEYNSQVIDNSKAMLIDVMEAGTFGGGSIVRWKAGRFLRFFYENEDKKMPKTKIALFFTFLFPKNKEMNHQAVDKYKRSDHVFISWLRRCVYLYKHWRKAKRNCSIRKRITCAQKRMKLLRTLNLMK